MLDIRDIPTRYILAAFLLFSMWCFSDPSKAEEPILSISKSVENSDNSKFGIVIAAGQSEFGYRDGGACGDGGGFWVQACLSQTDSNMKSPMWYAAISYQLERWLGVEVGYIDFGRATNRGPFCGDYDYQHSQCTSLTEGWMSTYTGYGGTRGWAVSVLPRYWFTDHTSFYTRLGLYKYETKWHVTTQHGNGSYGTGLSSWANDKWVRGGPTWLVGFGLQHKSLFIETLHALDISVSDSAIDNVTGLLVGYRGGF